MELVSTYQQKEKVAKVKPKPLTGGFIRRKCACGNHTIAGSECTDCRQDSPGLLPRAANQTVPASTSSIAFGQVRLYTEPEQSATVNRTAAAGWLQRDRGEPAPEGGASACPPETELDEIEQRYRDMIQAARDDGKTVAADNLQYFLSGSGGTRTLSVPWLRGFSTLTDAERVNQERFETQLNDQANGMSHGDRRTFSDHWDRMFTASTFEELYYASGTSTITSTGSFSLEMIEDVVRIHGRVDHHWHDPYDWHAGLSAYVPGFGSISDEDGLAMQNCRGASSFDMEADWQQRLSGTITVGTLWNDKEFTWSGP